MRITINLATRPFIELRPFFLRLRILMAVLAVIAIAFGLWAHALERRLDRATAQMNKLRDQTIAAQNERMQSERRMREPVNAAVLDRAHFLNSVFLRKSFSWTAVMMDLEQVLPAGVQVTSIEPEVTTEGDVIIRLRVSGERDRAVQLVRNLERSRRFLEPRLSGEAMEAKETGMQRGGPLAGAAPGAPAGVEFDILANYNPLPPGEPYPRQPPAAARPVSDVETPQRAVAGTYGVVLKPYRAPGTNQAARRGLAARGGTR